MTTYYVTANHKISTSVWNPPNGWILAEFPADEPVIPFNPLTLLSDGHLDEVNRLTDAAEAKAKQFLADLIASGHQPIEVEQLIK